MLCSVHDCRSSQHLRFVSRLIPRRGAFPSFTRAKNECLQDDILHEDLTVRENLAYSAWLRSNINMISEAKGEVVDDVLDLLRLRHVQVIIG